MIELLSWSASLITLRRASSKADSKTFPSASWGRLFEPFVSLNLANGACGAGFT